MHQKYYRTERERLEAEKKEDEARERSQTVDFEKILKDYPKRFEVARALLTERTFPACKSTVKAPVEM